MNSATYFVRNGLTTSRPPPTMIGRCTVTVRGVHGRCASDAESTDAVQAMQIHVAHEWSIAAALG